MGAQLNIKDNESIRWLRELAKARGRSITAEFRAVVGKEHAAFEAERQAALDWARHLSDCLLAELTEDERQLGSKQAADSIYVDGLPV